MTATIQVFRERSRRHRSRADRAVQAQRSATANAFGISVRGEAPFANFRESTTLSRDSRQINWTRSVFIASLENRDFDLMHPMQCQIRTADGCSYIASFAPAGIHASGESFSEAVRNLEDIIVAKYELFSELGEARLGDRMRHQYSVLKMHIRG